MATAKRLNVLEVVVVVGAVLAAARRGLEATRVLTERVCAHVHCYSAAAAAAAVVEQS